MSFGVKIAEAEWIICTDSLVFELCNMHVVFVRLIHSLDLIELKAAAKQIKCFSKSYIWFLIDMQAL